MGYTIDFNGSFKLNKTLDETTKTFLEKFAEIRHMVRKVGPEYGIEGEFYVAGTGDFGQDKDKNIVDYDTPPSTQPGLWCQWVPTEDGNYIEWDGSEKFYNYVVTRDGGYHRNLESEWDGGEKFYNYVEWLEYIIRNFLAPKGYVLNGTVQWQGEGIGDVGRIVVKDNVVRTQRAKFVYEDEA